MLKPFLNRLSEQPLLADGAMGTMLLAQGADPLSCLERLVVDEPERVAAIHRSYAAAGAEVVTSHTFGANRMRLATHGLAGEVHALNTRAVGLARSACAAETRWVAGNVGPVARPIDPDSAADREAVSDAFCEQIEALWAAGVDLLLLETFGDPAELALAVQAARSICELPLAASMTFDRDGKTLSGAGAATLAGHLHGNGVDLIGANCSEGPGQLADVLAVMQRAAPAAIFSVMPNAGIPEQMPGGLQYPCGPEDFAAAVPAFLEHGARLVGGCCGTTPAHVRAMRTALDAMLAAGFPSARASGLPQSG